MDHLLRWEDQGFGRNGDATAHTRCDHSICNAHGEHVRPLANGLVGNTDSPGCGRSATEEFK